MMCFPFDDKGHHRVLCAQPEKDPDRKEPVTLEEIQTHRAGNDRRPRSAAFRSALGDTFPHTAPAGRAVPRAAGVSSAGDAGHVHVPIGGQGMNYGMAGRLQPGVEARGGDPW